MILQLDPMALTALTDTQMSAVEYVLRKSKEASEKVYPQLLNKVLRLGFTEKDLERWDILVLCALLSRMRLVGYLTSQVWSISSFIYLQEEEYFVNFILLV